MSLQEFIVYVFWAKPRMIQPHEDGLIFWFYTTYPIWRVTVSNRFLGGAK